MKKYDLSLDGIPISVYLYEDIALKRDAVRGFLTERGYAVIMYPSTLADIGVTCYDKNNFEPREPHIAVVALSCFFRDVRGLPDISLEVEYLGKVYDMPVTGKGARFTVNFGKCKFLCAKTAEFNDGTEISVDILDNGVACIVAVCYDSEMFSREKLSRLSSLLGMSSNTPAVAVSFNGDINLSTVGSIAYYDAISYAVVALERHGITVPHGRLCARMGESVHSFVRYHGQLEFYPNIKYLS